MSKKGRYFVIYDPAWGHYGIVTPGIDGLDGATADLSTATVLNTVDDANWLQFASDYGLTVEYLPEDVQMRLNGQPTLFD